MKILFVNNDGGGFADYIEIESDTTVEDLFLDQVGGEASDYLIRVNRQPCAADQVLQEGDRISITPTKIEGGCVSRPRVAVDDASFRSVDGNPLPLVATVNVEIMR